MTYDTINDAVTMAGGEGTLLAGRYRIVRQLGQGGMGSVWLAEDTQLDNKPFAIKMLPAILVSNKRAYRQLKDEALVAMQLVHPNIVQIRAFEENNGNPFLVMDYIDGQTLDDYLADYNSRVEHVERVESALNDADVAVGSRVPRDRIGRAGAPSLPQGGLPEADVLRILRPIAAALDYAHSKGVVHRDVKPGNVMIAKDGTPYILDFGIAREIQETMTRVTGKLSSGTLLYMSPEQLMGESPKSAQDVYSFAAMVYECLKGEPPFSHGQIEFQIMNKQPEPLAIPTGGPSARGSGTLAASVMAGLAKKPEARPPTCTAVLEGSDFNRKERKERKDVVANGNGRVEHVEGENGRARSPSGPQGGRASTRAETGGPRPVAALKALLAVVALALAAAGGWWLASGRERESKPTGTTRTPATTETNIVQVAPAPSVVSPKIAPTPPPAVPQVPTVPNVPTVPKVTKVPEPPSTSAVPKPAPAPAAKPALAAKPTTPKAGDTKALTLAVPAPPVMARVDEMVVAQEKEAVRRLRDENTVEGLPFRQHVNVELGFWDDPARPANRYFRVRVASNPDNPLPIVSKDIVFMLDASGSIGNDRLKACRASVLEALDRLNSGDRFNVVAFRDKFEYAFPETAWCEMDVNSVERARNWLSTQKAHGKTDVFRTLKSVLAMPRDPARPIIAFVATDGDATSGMTRSAEIISRFSELNGGLVSIFMYGVKPEANAYLMDMITRCNRGGWSCHKGLRWLAAQGVPQLAKKFEKPVLTDVVVIFSSSSRADAYPKLVTNLCEDEPIEIYGVCPANQKELAFQMRGLNAVTAYESIFKLPFSSAKQLDGDLRTEWATRRLYEMIAVYTRTPNPRLLADMRKFAADHGLEVPYEKEMDKK